jgi:hypothetical protein
MRPAVTAPAPKGKGPDAGGTVGLASRLTEPKTSGTMPVPQYNTRLLVGRAFSHAHHDLSADAVDDAVEELCLLAAGDRMAIVLAQARFSEFLAGPTPSVEDARALCLLDATLDRFARVCVA